MPSLLPTPRRRASRAFLQALNALSPSSLFRANQQHAQTQARSPTGKTTTKPEMPAHVMDTLLQLVDFLEEHHRHAEGVYRKLTPSERETNEILGVLRDAGDVSLPDLAKFNPHAITAAIKEVLADDYAPLIPYRVSQALLERTAEQDETATLNTLIGVVKELAPVTRELLKVLLIHLHHISTSIPSRMSAKNLAAHVGVLLVRPTDETDQVAAKSAFKQRRRIARLLIENANALPYNETNRLSLSGGSELDIPNDTKNGAAKISKNEQGGIPTPPKDLHFVQVLWDTEVNTHTEETLTNLLLPFGHVATLAINESGNRAIVAFATDDGAQAAAGATLAGVRIRRRKQRTAASATGNVLSQSTGSAFTTPTPSPAKDLGSSEPQLLSHRQPEVLAPATDITPRSDVGECRDDHVTPYERVEQIEKSHTTNEPAVESPTFLYKLERPPSMLLVQKAMKTMLNGDQMTLEDVESPPNSPGTTQEDDKEDTGRRSLSRINEVTEEEERVAIERTGNDAVVNPQDVTVGSDNLRRLQRRRSLKELLTVVTAKSSNSSKEMKQTKSDGEKRKHHKGVFSPPAYTKIGLIADLKLMVSRKRTPRSVSETRSAVVVDHVRDSLAPVTEAKPREQAVTAYSCAEMRSIKTQTKMTIRPIQHQASDTDDLPKAETSDDSFRIELEGAHAQIEVLATCLNEVQSELANLASALSASRNDVDRAILRAHTILSNRISYVLNPDPVKLHEDDQHVGCNQNLDRARSATGEFVGFLEMRTSAQVKILEAEVRAGQELLRIHRSQHQKEIAELEGEVTRLRVVQNETEKMCCELRADSRRCRAELTFHIATAASIQSDRRGADEKLIICENKLRAKEQEFLQLQLAHDEMRETAGNAQRRLEEHRASKSLSQLPSKDTEIRHSSQSSTGAHFPKAAAFLWEHCSGGHQRSAASKANAMLLSVVRAGPFVNTEELASMKKRVKESIHTQVESTKNSLRELQAFGNNQQLDEDDMDLEELEQQLGSAQDDLNSTMNVSRQKLRQLLDPVSGLEDELHDGATGFFDPTGLVESLLANALSTECLETNQESASSPLQFQPVELMTPSWSGRSPDIQSEMFKKWVHGRTREPAKATPRIVPRTSAAGSKPKPQVMTGDAVRQAQQSMLCFQQTLASMKKLTQ